MSDFLKPETTVSECIQLFFDDDFRIRFIQRTSLSTSLPRYRRFIAGCDRLLAFYDGLATIAEDINFADRTMMQGLCYDSAKKVKGWRDNLPVEVYYRFE